MDSQGPGPFPWASAPGWLIFLLLVTTLRFCVYQCRNGYTEAGTLRRRARYLHAQYIPIQDGQDREARERISGYPW